MRKTMIMCAAALALVSGPPAGAQVSPSVIGQAVYNSMRGFPTKCYQGVGIYRTTARSFEEGSRRSELAMQDYLQQAANGPSLEPAFWHKQVDLSIDGSAAAASAARDPVAANVARLERVDLQVSHSNGRFHGQWRAIGSNGRAIGIYDAYLQRAKDRARIITLRFYSAGSSSQPAPLKPFCNEPGDIEKWQQAKAK